MSTMRKHRDHASRKQKYNKSSETPNAHMIGSIESNKSIPPPPPSIGAAPLPITQALFNFGESLAANVFGATSPTFSYEMAQQIVNEIFTTPNAATSSSASNTTVQPPTSLEKTSISVTLDLISSRLKNLTEMMRTIDNSKDISDVIILVDEFSSKVTKLIHHKNSRPEAEDPEITKKARL